MSNNSNEEGGSVVAAVIVVGLIVAALSDNAPDIFVGLCAIAMGLGAILLIAAPIAFCYGALNKLFGGKW